MPIPKKVRFYKGLPVYDYLKYKAEEKYDWSIKFPDKLHPMLKIRLIPTSCLVHALENTYKEPEFQEYLSKDYIKHLVKIGAIKADAWYAFDKPDDSSEDYGGYAFKWNNEPERIALKLKIRECILKDIEATQTEDFSNDRLSGIESEEWYDDYYKLGFDFDD